MSKVIGIDISKKTFDVGFLVISKWQHKVFDNTEKGFKKLLKLVEPEDWVVMEASGPYYLQLATFFYNADIKVSVLNPLIIKRYSQARLYRAKTDKKDAKTIAEYGGQYELKKWQPESAENVQIKQLYTAVQLLQKQKHQTKMQLKAFESTGLISKELRQELNQVVLLLGRRIEKLEKKIELIATSCYKESIKKLKTIPGVGIKTAVMMCVITNNFSKFENYKQLIAYVGFSPRLYQSGTSVRGKGHICKMGKGQIRKLLYLCSWTAKRYNKKCVEMYTRLEKKGKPERVIKIALANKLLKQIFSIGKNQQNYSADYERLYVA